MHDVTGPAAAPASENEQVQAAWNQLNLVLGFFPRIDTRLSAVLALDLGMLALIGGRWPAWDAVTLRMMCLTVGFLFPLCVSFYYLWVAIVPDRRGGTGSLVFFRSIASMQESDFRSRFLTLSNTQLACDLLEQAWRNARVLECKFDSLRIACLGMAVAVPAWVWLLMELPAKSSS
jgi:hypothetical protein